MQKRNKGITLISLVITIIVLLILAGIVISLTIGENGIINKAKESGLIYDEQQAREKLELVLLDLQADKITSLDYNENEYIDNRIIENQMNIVDDIVYVNEWAFSIDRSVPCIKEALGKNSEMVNSYIKDGLILWYDGENNTGSGHSSTAATWKDLSGNNNDAQLMNVNHTPTSGWSSNSLKLDGIDDWVKMMELNYPEITIEIVVKNISVTPDKEQHYISNLQTRGIWNNKRYQWKKWICNIY